MRRSLAVVKQLVPTARVAQARTLITRRPLITPCAEVGCSSWAGRPRTFATAPPKDSSETTNNESTHANLGAEFMEEVELDDAEWEGEEVSEGVFISVRISYRW